MYVHYHSYWYCLDLCESSVQRIALDHPHKAANVVWCLFFIFPFAALLVSIGSCLGTYSYIKYILKHNYSDYGISMSIGRNYQGLMWGAVVGALLNFILWCSVRSRPTVIYANAPIEEKPLI